ncbi:hypothetical protein DXG01_003749 [Tephrocybe rancida]|nr:hypothetical protein DXG01_003749 [Tephrocybe rancida]
MPLDYFNGLPRDGIEKDMHEPFINLVHDSNPIPGFKIVNTSNNEDPNGRKITPDPTIRINIEFTVKSERDPRLDERANTDPYTSEARSKCGTGTRSQFIDYAAEDARFIRGIALAPVSAQFNHFEGSGPSEFLWRFAHLNDSQRAQDTKVRPQINTQETKLARDKLSEWAPKQERLVVVFTIPGNDGKDRQFIAWGSMTEPTSITGRCTSTYLVYEIAT